MQYKKLTPDAILLPAVHILQSEAATHQKSDDERVAASRLCPDLANLPQSRAVAWDGRIPPTRCGIKLDAQYMLSWQVASMKALGGVYDPQSDKVFFELLTNIKNAETMVALGSEYAFYPLWFLNIVKGGRAYFVGNDAQCAAAVRNVAHNSADALIIQETLSLKDETLGIVHADMIDEPDQKLRLIERLVKQGRVRFVMMTTRHYAESGDFLAHERCVGFVAALGGRVITDLPPQESYAGRGIVAVSFDANNTTAVTVSHCAAIDSPFRPAEADIAMLSQAHDQLLALHAKSMQEAQTKIAELGEELDVQKRHLQELEATVNEVLPIKRHIKREVKERLKRVNAKVTGKLSKATPYKPARVPASGDLLRAVQESDRANFAEYNKAAQDTALLKAYVASRKRVAGLARKMLKGKL